MTKKSRKTAAPKDLRSRLLRKACARDPQIRQLVEEEERRYAKRYGPGAEAKAPEEAGVKDSKTFFSPDCPDGAYDIVFDMVAGELREDGKRDGFQHYLLALRRHGTPAEITEKIDAVKKTIEIMKKYRPGRAQTIYELEDLAEHLEKVGADMAEIEAGLAKKGLKIDATGTAVYIAKGNKGKSLLAKLTERVMKAVPDFENTAYTRRKIAGILAPLFDAEELRSDTRGAVYRVIDKAKRRSGK